VRAQIHRWRARLLGRLPRWRIPRRCAALQLPGP